MLSSLAFVLRRKGDPTTRIVWKLRKKDEGATVTFPFAIEYVNSTIHRCRCCPAKRFDCPMNCSFLYVGGATPLHPRYLRPYVYLNFFIAAMTTWIALKRQEKLPRTHDQEEKQKQAQGLAGTSKVKILIFLG